MATIPVVASGILIMRSLDNRLTDQAGAHVESMAEVEALLIGERLGQITDGFDTARIAAASLWEITPSNDLTQRLSQLAETTHFSRPAVILFDADRHEIARTVDARSLPSAADLELATVHTRPLIIDPNLNPDGETRIGVVAPILDLVDERILGYAAAEYDLSPLFDHLGEVSGIEGRSSAHVTRRIDDDIVQLIAATDRTEITPLWTELVSPTGPSSPAGPVAPVAADDENELRASAPVPGVDWEVVVEMDADDALAVANSARGLIGNALAVVAVAAALGWLVLVRPVGRRLSGLSDAAKRVSTGDYGNPINDRRTDEIGSVAQSIDRLAGDLRADIGRRTAAEARLRFEATHDSLTQLRNRLYAAEHLRRLRDDTSGADYSVLFLDLDEFKTVNDEHGHGVGDEVLVTIARRLDSTVAGRGIVCRWGGDEFIVILGGLDSSDAQAVAVEVAAAVDEPIVTSAGRHWIGCSVGVAAASDVSYDKDSDVLQLANERMFENKVVGREVHRPRARIYAMVEQALAHRRVEVWYQPVFRVGESGDAVLTGAEALVRLRDVNGELKTPGDFFGDIAEQRLGAVVDERVLDIALDTLATWRDRGIVNPDFRLAVNLCGASMRSPYIAEGTSRRLAQLGLDPTCLVLEICEEIKHLDHDVVSELRRRNIHLAIDDVGLSCSNLDRLAQTGAQFAKLDRRWLLDSGAVGGGPDGPVLPRLIDICHDLGMTVVAEGVETPQQLAVVSSLGVDLVQGFMFGAPTPPDEFVARWCAEPTPESAGVLDLRSEADHRRHDQALA